LVARILVADDNSNIQKMVGLALKDQGIDVVAVGNGEAAVRKISDIKPDLVLADVFMPVRNGYEVCQYVKGDPALAHIPVILLVGAFDPLDEQEAQRVGADGVLKKPFVPPDPLISMVKSALTRAGVLIGGAPAPPKEEEPRRAAEMLAPRPQPSMATLPPVEEFPSVDSEPLPDMPGRPEPVRIDAGSQPLAFGSLLETPVAGQEQEDDMAFAATTPRPELERDWKAKDEEDEVAEEEEDEKDSASWRRDAGNEEMEEEPAASAVKDWRQTAFSEGPARKMRDDSWAPQKEISRFEEAAETEQSVGTFVTEAPVAAAETTASASRIAAFSEEAWASVLAPKTALEVAPVETPAVQNEQFVEDVRAVVPAEVQAVAHAEIPAPVTAEVPVRAPLHAAPEPEPAKPAASNSWFSSVASPWDAEAQKAAQLASTWDAPAAAAPVSPANEYSAAPILETAGAEVTEAVAKKDSGVTVDSLSPALSADVKAKLEEVALPEAAVAELREEAHQVAETAVQEMPPAATTAKVSEPSMEDMVAKVLAKMSPEMLQAVTRDILKNVVESMVRDELNAKK
jgi:CheY-like chemotaxis protein